MIQKNRISSSRRNYLLLYLLLNIAVSVITSFIIIQFWGPARIVAPTAPTVVTCIPPEATVIPPPQEYIPQIETGTEEPPANTPQAEKQPEENLSTAYSEEGVFIRIESIIGLGDLENETIIFRRNGTGQLALLGWKLVDETGQEFIFPDLVLNEGASVQLHTKIGVNTVMDLFWGLDKPVWHTGDTVRLLDVEGNQQASFRVQ